MKYFVKFLDLRSVIQVRRPYIIMEIHVNTIQNCCEKPNQRSWVVYSSECNVICSPAVCKVWADIREVSIFLLSDYIHSSWSLYVEKRFLEFGQLRYAFLVEVTYFPTKRYWFYIVLINDLRVCARQIFVRQSMLFDGLGVSFSESTWVTTAFLIQLLLFAGKRTPKRHEISSTIIRCYVSFVFLQSSSSRSS